MADKRGATFYMHEEHLDLLADIASLTDMSKSALLEQLVPWDGLREWRDEKLREGIEDGAFVDLGMAAN